MYREETLSGAATPGQSRSGSNGNEGVLLIPQISRINGALSSFGLMSCLGHSFAEGCYPSAEMQSVNFTASHPTQMLFLKAPFSRMLGLFCYDWFLMALESVVFSYLVFQWSG